MYFSYSRLFELLIHLGSLTRPGLNPDFSKLHRAQHVATQTQSAVTDPGDTFMR